eukprot:317543-Chlamydomonas_euryale.AAC.1
MSLQDRDEKVWEGARCRAYSCGSARGCALGCMLGRDCGTAYLAVWRFGVFGVFRERLQGCGRHCERMRIASAHGGMLG